MHDDVGQAHMMYYMYTTQKKFKVTCGSHCYVCYCDVFSEALSISPRVLINGVSFVGKSMSRIMNFNSLQWV